MTKPRVAETDQGIQGEFTVALFNEMQRGFRDKGQLETPEILKHGITYGHALEIGPGPGYLGLEWLKHTQGTTLTGLDISPDMIALAERNARDYGLAERVTYMRSNGNQIPFDDGTFDAVFSNGSLHEWADPQGTFNEIGRVSKSQGKVFISDLRRDILLPVKWFFWISVRPTVMRPGLITSLNAAYTQRELNELIKGTRLATCGVSGNIFGLWLSSAN